MTPQTTQATVQTVVVILGLITLALIGGAFTLLAMSKTVPDPVWTLSGVGVGAFGSLLASTRTNPAPNNEGIVQGP